MTRLASRAGRLSISPTMTMTATVDRLRRDGVTVIDPPDGAAELAERDLIEAILASAATNRPVPVRRR